jgi:photosystem II stability/assembly factor-like uncharacterized protein
MTKHPRRRPAGLPRSGREALTRRAKLPRRRWQILVMALAGGAILALAAWIVFGRGKDGDDRPLAVPVIAQLETPDIHALLIDPDDPDHLLFGSHAGLHESWDGGFTWTEGTLQAVDAMSLSVSPQDPATFYIAGHDVLLVSRDGGHQWQPLVHDLPGTDIHAFAQDPLEPTRLYAFIVGAGIFTSVNGGETWTVLPTQPSEGAPLVLATNGDSLYAGLGTGLVVSRNHGTTWEPIPGDLPGIPITIAAPATDSQLLYVGTQRGLVKSTDGGQRWSWIAETSTPVLALAAAPSEPTRVVMVGEEGVVSRSDDGGHTWVAPNGL